jgi:hypothetical protein
MAHDQVLDREVAIKMMFTQDAVVGEHRRRFFYEARATARLAHPGSSRSTTPGCSRTAGRIT